MIQSAPLYNSFSNPNLAKTSILSLLQPRLLVQSDWESSVACLPSVPALNRHASHLSHLSDRPNARTMHLGTMNGKQGRTTSRKHMSLTLTHYSLLDGMERNPRP